MEGIHRKKAYAVLGAAAGINLVSGMLYIWGIISRTLIDQLGWSSKQASLPYTLATVSFVIAMVIFGRIQDQKGPRWTATIGVILMGGGAILSGLKTEPVFVAIAFGLIAGSGIGILNVSTTPPAMKWFPKEKKGMVTGVVVGGVSVSSMMYSPLANWLNQSYGVAAVFLVVGGISLVIGMILAQVLKNPPETPASKQTVLERAQSLNDHNWQEMLRSPKFWVIWLMLALSSSAGLMVIGHVVSIAKVQAGWAGGFLLVMLLALFNTFGRFGGGSLSDKLGRLNLIRGIFVLQMFNMLAFTYLRSVPTLAVGVAVAGMCYGAIFSVFPATISDLYGLKHFGVNFGLMFTGWGVGGIIGPMTGAWIYDLTGQFTTAYFVSAGLLLVALGLSFLFSRMKVGTKGTVPGDS
ncbi:L-lactate MFS transporter [Acidaminobacter hydrogenoformans]|uniref:Nitrate/nitrite transporter NarK n=1 Tax=Acidaminobacter hydrogenoformans DSM 2784 TaxID=1120920 RepID=A0A1G5S3F8_9FIRM|nr:OFA family MFS transporter [Acidaminobacter hydrogenoformans]SCZ80863.1 Nitrate/nitrite transporter NarK [Acidaminobacter hydrogenoformans DSM 2784]